MTPKSLHQSNQIPCFKRVFSKFWIVSVSIAVLLGEIGGARVAIARDITGRPDFFDQGQELLEREVQRLEQASSDPILTIDPNTPRWQPIVSEAGQFSVWMPPGVLSQETRTLDTKLGNLAFQVTASKLGDQRYVVGYSSNLTNAQTQDPTALLTAVRDSVAAKTEFQISSDRPISLKNYPGREFQLTQSDETITFHTYVAGNRLYLLGVKQKGGNQLPQAATTFFSSFRVL